MKLGDMTVLTSGLLMVWVVGCSGDTTGTSGSGGLTGTGATSGLGTGGSNSTGGTTVGPGTGGVSATDIDAAAARLSSALAAYCTCLPAGAEQDSCIASVTMEGLVVDDCQRQVLMTSDGQVMVDCVSNLISDVETCMDAAGCSQTAVESCFTAFDTGMSACDSAQPVVSAQLDACPSSAGDFMCNDGSPIPEDWVCDGVPDCPGGEDEVGC